MAVMRNRWRIAVALIALIGAAWVTARAQGLGPGSSGSLAELTAEVRLLRLAIQDHSQADRQMQALNIQLSAQQSRLSQVAARLDGIRAEMAAAAQRSRSVARELAAMQADAARVTAINERAAIDQQLKALKSEVSESASQETQLQAREAEMVSMFRAEEQRWRELSSRLDALLRK